MKDQNTLTVTIKQVFGRDLIYPYCDKAYIFARLTNKKTLDSNDIEKIKTLGFTINQTQKTL